MTITASVGGWLTVPQTARALRLSRRQVCRLIDAGTLTARRAGGTWVVEADAVLDEITRRRGQHERT